MIFMGKIAILQISPKLSQTASTSRFLRSRKMVNAKQSFLRAICYVIKLDAGKIESGHR